MDKITCVLQRIFYLYSPFLMKTQSFCMDGYSGHIELQLLLMEIPTSI